MFDRGDIPGPYGFFLQCVLAFSVGILVAMCVSIVIIVVMFSPSIVQIISIIGGLLGFPIILACTISRLP